MMMMMMMLLSVDDVIKNEGLEFLSQADTI
jgi:hypothetical protein